MNYFNLPDSTFVKRIIPKNAFDDYTNTRQKKEFAKVVEKIRWLNKISKETINLEFNEIQEIQIFEIELREKKEIPKLLEVIEKAIPYHIIFLVHYKDEAYISTTKKHPNPLDENKSVIDWTFKSDWFKLSESKYILELRKNIDFVYKTFCLKISGAKLPEETPIAELINNQEKIKTLKNEIDSLKSQIAKEKQFNKKVELNLKLKEVENNLNKFLS
jgi:hypothetical protein